MTITQESALAQKTIYLPPTFDTESYLRDRLDKAEERIENNGGNFVGFGSSLAPSANGQFQFNPFGLPQSAQFPGSEMLSNANTVFKNLRWYFVSNFRQMLSEMYVELGLVQTIVDVPVNDAFRGGVEIKSKQLSERQIQDIQISIDRDDDLNTIAQTAKWTRLFGGGGTLILTDQDPRTPLDLTAITKDSPLEFRAVDLWELFWDKQNTEGYDPQLQAQEFEYYNYYGEIIHKSRVMRMKGMIAPSFVRPRLRGWGFSVVETLIRSINQYLKATDLAFEVLDEFKLDVYRIKNLVNTLLAPQGANKVKQRIAVANQIKNYQNAIVMDVEDEYTQKQLSFSGLAETMGQIRMQVASDMRMPMTKLFGISAAGFNSGEDDIEVYNAMVEAEVRNKVKYQILRMLEVKCQKMFGMIPDDLLITFKPLRVMSAVQEEEVKTQKFNRLSQAATQQLISTEQFIDAANKDQLFGIVIDKEGLFNPPQGDISSETPFRDPLDSSKAIDDPGANKPDVRTPRAWEVGGAPKGLEKEKAPPQDAEVGKTGAEKADPKAAGDPDKSKRPWMDAPKEEDEKGQRQVQLGKAKELHTDDEAKVSEPRDPKVEKKPKAGTVTPKKTEAPDAAPHPEKRRINNANVQVTNGKIVVNSIDNGEARTARDGSGKMIKRGDRVSYKGAIATVEGIDSDNSIRINFPQIKGQYQKFEDGKWTPDFTETGAEAVRKMNADGPYQFPDRAAEMFDPFAVDDEDMVRNPKDKFMQPNDKAVDNKYCPLEAGEKAVRNIAIVALVSGPGKGEWILTGKRRDTALWTSPGGSVCPGETFENAAIRELFEETGIQVLPADLQPLVMKDFVYPDHITRVCAYVVKLKDRVPARTTLDPDNEVESWRWVPLKDSSLELKKWNRQADEDIVINKLLGGM